MGGPTIYQKFLKFTAMSLIQLGLTGVSGLKLSNSGVLWLEPQRIISLIGLVSGTVLIGLAGYEARARALELQPPFTNDPLGWRKAKESYKTQEDPEGQETKGKWS